MVLPIICQESDPVNYHFLSRHSHLEDRSRSRTAKVIARDAGSLRRSGVIAFAEVGINNALLDLHISHVTYINLNLSKWYDARTIRNDKVLYIIVFNMQRKCNAGCKRGIRGGERQPPPPPSSC